MAHAPASKTAILLVALLCVGGFLGACGEESGSGDSAKTQESTVADKAAVEVPDVVGDRARAAKQALTEEGLLARIKRRFDDTASKGEVVRQKPGGGKEADRGDPVTLVVSRGSKPAPEPEPTPEPTPTETTEEPTGDCDPSYPDVCIPSPPPDLNCPDVDEQNFAVKGDDPHGFDADGDGVGCES